jgi:hypothetical protein
MLLKRKNTDILSKSAQSLKKVNDDDDELFFKKTENPFHERMYVKLIESYMQTHTLFINTRVNSLITLTQYICLSFKILMIVKEC